MMCLWGWARWHSWWPVHDFLKIFYWLIFWLHWVCVAVCRLSLVAARGGYSWLWCMGFSLPWLLLLQSSGTQAQWLHCTGLATQRHVESSWTRNRTCIPCTGRWILIHWTTRGVPIHALPSKLALNLQTGSTQGECLTLNPFMGLFQPDNWVTPPLMGMASWGGHFCLPWALLLVHVHLET